MLACLEANKAHSLPEIRAAAAELMHVTDEDQLAMLPCGMIAMESIG